jgi:hypothetical protein
MEYMNPANSYLVKYKLTEIEMNHGPYREGMWAEPDLDHAAELMRHVFKNRKEAREIGHRGRLDILKALSEERVGGLMRDRLLRLAELGRVALPIGERQEDVQPERRKNGLYSQLVSRIRRVVEAEIPQDSRVLVVSRGDNQLVEFDERDGVHFPQMEDGRYAGHHPADDKEAIQRLEALRDKGCRYLLFPQTAFWWLDYYKDLESHLQSQHRRIWSDPDCIIYRLSKSNGKMPGRIKENLVLPAAKSSRKLVTSKGGKLGH